MVRCTIVLDGGAEGLDTAEMRRRFARIVPDAHIVTLPPLDLAGRLDSFAESVAASTGPLLLVDTRYCGHDSPLVDVLADPHEGSAVLTDVDGVAWPARVSGGVILDAGSAVHGVPHPTTQYGAALRVGSSDRAIATRAIADLQSAVSEVGWRGLDLLPILAVALVRSGLRVRSVPTRGFVASLPETEDQRSAAKRALEASNEHRLRLAGAAREGDGFYSTFVIRRLSKFATALALKLRVTPNQVTGAALVIAALAAAAFAVGGRAWWVLGAVLLQVSLVVDCVDGELARYTRQHSALGAWLDAGTDRIKEFGVYAGLAVGAARSGDDVWFLAAAVLGLQVTRHFVDFGFAVRQSLITAAETTPVVRPLTDLSSPAIATTPGRSPDGVAAQLGRSATSLSDRTNQVHSLIWLKRAIIMPIGERWLIISLATAVVGPRLALALLLILGAVAATYTTIGRVLRTASSVTTPPGGAEELAMLSDLGIFSTRSIGLFTRRFAWLLPAASRAIEYVAPLAAAMIVGGEHLPLVFAHLFVLATWHYDMIYRLRFTRVGPSQAVQRLLLGAPTRSLLILAAAFVAGSEGLRWALLVLSAGVLTVTVVDSSAAWRKWLTEQSDSFRVPRFTVVAR